MKRLFSTFIGCASRFSSMTTRMPCAVRLIAQVADAVQLAFAHQIGDPLHERRLVDLVGQFGDDDLVAPAPRRLLDERLGANDDTAAPGGVGGFDALRAQDDAAGRKIRPRDDLDQVLDGARPGCRSGG